MAVARHYTKAPLTEALLEIRVQVPADVSVQLLATVQEGLHDRYPTRSDHFQITSQVAVRGGAALVSASANSAITGHIFTSSDSRRVFQARIDGFAFSWLAPYGRWETFRDEARALWNVYRNVAQPVQVQRFAVRYINRFDLPVGSQLEDYFLTYPQIASGLSQSLSGLLMRLELPQHDIASMLVLHQAIIPPSTPSIASVVLDIDLFRDSSVPQDDRSLWDAFEEFRVRKNDIFEACITDQARRMIS